MGVFRVFRAMWKTYIQTYISIHIHEKVYIYIYTYVHIVTKEKTYTYAPNFQALAVDVTRQAGRPPKKY